MQEKEKNVNFKLFRYTTSGEKISLIEPMGERRNGDTK